MKPLLTTLLFLCTVIVFSQSGNVGINTTTPSERLEVNQGNIEISSIGFTNSRGLKFSETSNPLYGWIYNGINNRIHLREYFSDSSDVLTILSDGKVGIGTSSPSHWFEINRGSGFQIKLNNPDAGGEDWYVGASDDTWNMGGGRLAISKDGSSGGAVFMIDPDDKIGVGVTSPQANLHIHKPGVTSKLSVVRFTNSITGSSGNDGVTIGLGVGDHGVIWHNENEPILFATNNTERVRITEGGQTEFKEDIEASKSIVFNLPGSSSGEGILIKEASGDAFAIVYDGSGSGASNKLIFRDLVGTDTDALTIYGDGDVQVGGEAVPSGYKMSIDGKVICEEVRVKLSENWPDYVFEEDYVLMPLAELRNFINQKNHLPGIPASSVMEKTGLGLGEMQRILVEKIEELTLYTLRQQEEIEKLKCIIQNQ